MYFIVQYLLNTVLYNVCQYWQTIFRHFIANISNVKPICYRIGNIHCKYYQCKSNIFISVAFHCKYFQRPYTTNISFEVFPINTILAKC